MAAKVLQMHHIDVHAVYGRWLPGHQDTRILIIRPLEGNELVPRAHSYIQMAAARIQDTGYYRLQGDTGYRTLHAPRLKFRKDTGHIGYRMQD